MSDQLPVKVGDVLEGKFRVERVLGQGGMGVVVAAWHLQLEQKVALKFLLPDSMADGDTVARFLREARASAKLRSENAAKVLDVGTLATGAPYIVMEFLEGRDLDALLEDRGSVPVDEAVNYVLQACRAIAEAHAAGIIHRDLKPANFFLTTGTDGSPCIKVLDFGISKNIEQDANAGMTKTRAMLGTPYFMSPEQMRSSRRVDQRSDIWALGVILCQLTTGHICFERDTLAELFAAVLTEPPTPPRSFNPDLPEEFETVILRCLEKDPEKRYSNLAELCSDLAPFCPEQFAAVEQVARILSLPVASPSGANSLSDPQRLSRPNTPPRSLQRPATPTNSVASLPTIAQPSAPLPAQESPRRPWGSVLAAGALGVVLLGGWFARSSSSTEPATNTPATTTPSHSAAPAVDSAPTQPQPSAAASLPGVALAPSGPPSASSPPAASAPPVHNGQPTAKKNPPKPPPTPKGGVVDFGGRK